MLFPTPSQYEEIAEELEGQEETWANALFTILDQRGLDTDLIYSPTFMDNLESRVYVCGECDVWTSKTDQVLNIGLDKYMCTDCDSNY